MAWFVACVWLALDSIAASPRSCVKLRMYDVVEKVEQRQKSEGEDSFA